MLMVASASVTLKRGSLYLSRAICDRYFAGLDTIILLRRNGDLLILPVRNAAAGGYFLKLRNSGGDRVVNAPDFFREQGFEEERERNLPVTWDASCAGLVASDTFVLQS
jgi:hypothetical protein